MPQPFWREHLPTIAVGLLNVFAIGLGMGVPIFAIVLGFPVGWYVIRAELARAAELAEGDPYAHPVTLHGAVRPLVGRAGALALVTLVLMAVIWGPLLPTAFDPSYEASEMGIPLILYTSAASKVGWLVLMVLISPLLQFMAVVTGGALRLVATPR